MPSANEILEANKYLPNYAIRMKRGGNVIFVSEDRQVWSLTDKYLKPLESSLLEKYDDWEAMEEGNKYWPLVSAVSQNKEYIEFENKQITIFSRLWEDKDPSIPDEEAHVSNEALLAAGQIAEALGKCIPEMLKIDVDKAKEGYQQLLYFSKSVSWLTKSNRNKFQSKFTPKEKKE